MKNVLRLTAVSSLLALVWVHPGTASSTKSQAPRTPAPSEINLIEIGIPKTVEKACRVVIPVAADDYVNTAKNTPVTFSPLWNDTDTPAQDLNSFSQPQHGTVELVGIDALKYTPDAGYVGSDSFSYVLGGCLQCFNGWCSEPEVDDGMVYITVTN